MVNLGKIIVLAKERGIALKALAEQAGITYQALNKLVRTNSTKVETIVSISRVLNVSPCVFFEEQQENASTAGVFTIEYLKEKDRRIEELIFENAKLSHEIESMKKRTALPDENAGCADAV